MIHRKLLKTDKIFFGAKASIFAIIWGLWASLRRVLSIIGFFTPSLGLFSMLYHWHAEQYPFTIRNKYDPLPIDQIELFNMTVGPWSDLDRWKYELPDEPSPPSYREYTGFDLKHTFIMFFIIMFLHCVVMTIVKYLTSKEFKEKGAHYEKMIHVLKSINIAFPYVDWDEGMFTIEEFRIRFRNTEVEMFCSFAVNIMFSLIMMVPIWYTGNFCPIVSQYQ